MTPEAAKALLTCAAYVLALAIWLPAQALFAQPAADKDLRRSGMADGCQALMAQKQQLADELQAQDAAWADRVAGMDKWPGPERSDAVAAVVTELVMQRAAINARRAGMDTDVVAHMALHRRASRWSLGPCPLVTPAAAVKLAPRVTWPRGPGPSGR
ncbi:MAG: hypothetical protein HZB16_19265 [Armatimonadetes bacterium]|nr:hypothetical protein [Armatimonadota bacterium]